ncbi:MAG TPA: DUF6644 family protein [Verrucomicrobiae bacterium]|nr:DUF6644 family protein [Verrucomicrobiae bacterium]
MFNFFMAVAKWLQTTWWALDISGSTWAYPFVQATHFAGLSLWIGTNLSLDLRLLGIGSRRQTPSQLSQALFAWNWLGLCVAVAGGFMLFSSAATKYIPNPAFEIKLGILVPFGILWHIFVQRYAKVREQADAVTTLGKIAGLIELLIWFSVITAAVSIPNFDTH